MASICADQRFSGGSHGTLISLGCLSEPLASHSVEATIAFLNASAGRMNPKQLATRWVVGPRHFDRFAAAVRRASVVLFHSFSTITRAREFERGTPALERRFEFVQKCADSGLRSVLYIKPFLPGITANDGNAFLDLSKRAHASAIVVGSLFTDERVAAQLSHLIPPMHLGGFRVRDHPVGDTPRSEGESPTPAAAAFIERMRQSGLDVFTHSRDVFSSPE